MPFRPVQVGLIQTVLPGVKDSVLAKTVKRHRSAAGALGQPAVAPSGASPHDDDAVAEALNVARAATATWW